MMKTKLKIIGVAGTAAAGKDTVAELLCRLFQMQNLSSGDVVRAVTRHVYHLPPDFNPVRDQLYEVANYMRNEIDPAAIVKLCVLEAQAMNIPRAVISGLRSMGEAEAIRHAGGVIIGVDADPHVRYERINSRARDAESQKTLEEFLKQDEYENRGLSDSGPARGIRSIIESADLIISNAGSLEELELELQHSVAPLLQ
jgi:dephospho-CoA kinase